MKKLLAGVALAAVVLRLAALAGAGEALASWVRELDVSDRVVAASLGLAFGGAPETAETEAAPEETPEPAAEAEPEPPQAAPEELAETVRLVAVTRAPQSEEVPPAAPEEPAETVALNLGGASPVHNSSGLDVDFDALAAEGLSLRLEAGQPQVLIIHTHSSEAYAQDPYHPYEASDPYRTEDKNYSVIRVGDALAEKFEESGLSVLHDREIYDYPSYTGSYSRSGAAVERYLAEYPSIRIVIDVHRDAIGSGDVVYKTQATLDGRSSAQVMLLVGTGQNGLYHPNWRENLKTALYLQSAAEDRWPTLTRPLELVAERYNQQLCTGMMIMEVGSTGNTLEEAVLAAERFGEAAGAALAKLVE